MARLQLWADVRGPSARAEKSLMPFSLPRKCVGGKERSLTIICRSPRHLRKASTTLLACCRTLSQTFSPSWWFRRCLRVRIRAHGGIRGKAMLAPLRFTRAIREGSGRRQTSLVLLEHSHHDCGAGGTSTELRQQAGACTGPDCRGSNSVLRSCVWTRAALGLILPTRNLDRPFSRQLVAWPGGEAGFPNRESRPRSAKTAPRAVPSAASGRFCQ